MKCRRALGSDRTAELERRLRKAEETLRAIRSGEADALVVSGPKGDRVYTLEDADRPYRLLMEELNEGAAEPTHQGDVLFRNRYLQGRRSRTVPDDAAIALYRFPQEVLLNAERHAEAESIQVALWSESEGISLLVEGDRKGFDVRGLERSGGKGQSGYGLFKMRERFTQLGGRLDVQSWRARGTRLRASVPVERGDTGD